MAMCAAFRHCPGALRRVESSCPWVVSRHCASLGRARREPSSHVQTLADRLLALKPKELEELRKECRERLIPKPYGMKGPAPKAYNPVLKVKREDAPFPMRSRLQTMGQRFASLHPVYVFAGHGPGMVQMPLPSVTGSIMGPHMGAAMEALSAAVPSVAMESASAQPASNESTDVAASPEQDEANTEEVEKPKAAVLKQSLTLRLVGFETAKKLSVVKEVRAIWGQGLKEAKELVERAPVILRKNVLREDAEAQAEKLKSAGAEIALE